MAQNLVEPDVDQVISLRTAEGWTQDQLAKKAGVSEKTIENIEAGRPVRRSTLAKIANALDVTISDLLPVMPADQSPPNLANHIHTFEHFIDDRRKGFVGRGFIFERIQRLLDDASTPSGYLLIRGDPGIGKSALMAELAKGRRLRGVRLGAYHFNISLQAINTVEAFLENVCAQLIANFRLSYDFLPDGFDRDGAFLHALLAEAAQKCKAGEKIVLAVDALDEVDSSGASQSANPLYLPFGLPDGIYVIMTARDKYDLTFHASSLLEFAIVPDSDENTSDVMEYVASYLGRKGVKEWMRRNKLDRARFTDLMSGKSEGNFMYLHHVLRAIDGGALSGFAPDQLPHGLRSYYRFHWAQMRQTTAAQFDILHLPVICVLAAVNRAVPISQVAKSTGISARRVRQAIQQWWEFLHKEPARGKTINYRVYHSSFREFLQKEVDPDLETYHAMIAKAALGPNGCENGCT